MLRGPTNIVHALRLPLPRPALCPRCCLLSFSCLACRHKEDIDLYSINYVHFGAPKVGGWVAGRLALWGGTCCCEAGGARNLSATVTGCSSPRGAPQDNPRFEAALTGCLLSPSLPLTPAVQVWYCVSPKDNPKFEAMAEALYPELYRNCKGFMRHKVGAGRGVGSIHSTALHQPPSSTAAPHMPLSNTVAQPPRTACLQDILVSPKVLRQYNVPYVQAKQEAGEFIVLNAAAYHAGYNCGFNCAGGCGCGGQGGRMRWS